MAYEIAAPQQLSDNSAGSAAVSHDPGATSHQRLSRFAFLMAAHRMPVSVSMMAGDTGYLRQQLRLACTTDDDALQQLATAILRELAGERSIRQANDLWSH